MEYEEKERHRHDESDCNEDKMRAIFLHMDDFLFGVSLLECKEVEILDSSLELIPEIFEHRHIVGGDILGSILAVELRMDTCHLGLDTERARDQCGWSV